MADVPHFAFPFRWGANGHAAVNEQNTVEDVAACVETALRTRPGERDGHPAFGVPDLVFTQLPLDTEAIATRLTTSEPRVRLLVEERPDLMDEAVTRARLTVDTQQE